MKKLNLYLLLLLLLTACNTQVKSDNDDYYSSCYIVKNISRIDNGYEKSKPKILSKYYLYNNNIEHDNITFVDSSGKFNVGDSVLIKFYKKQ